MQIIFDAINKAVQDNLAIIILLLIVVSILYLINIALGSVIGNFEEGFIPKKFLFGFLKGFITCLCIFSFCFVLNLFAVTLSYINVSISTDTISTLEVIAVAITWALDLSKEILEKVKSIKELKYTSYDDVQFQENSETSYSGGIG